MFCLIFLWKSLYVFQDSLKNRMFKRTAIYLKYDCLNNLKIHNENYECLTVTFDHASFLDKSINLFHTDPKPLNGGVHLK